MLASSGLVKVLDFGVGLILDDVDGGRLTNSNETVGTARYMAPEQATQRNITAAVDLYALGCVLFEMLVGAPPFDGDLQYEILNKHIGQQPAPVSRLRGEVPAGLEAVVARLLEKDPANRPGTAAEVAELLLPFARQAEPGVIGAPGNPVLALREQEAASGRDDEDAGGVGGAPPRPAPEPQPASAAGFDIFDVHQRLIREYRDYMLFDPAGKRLARLLYDNLPAEPDEELDKAVARLVPLEKMRYSATRTAAASPRRG